MKKCLKVLLAWLNSISLSLFCRSHFRAQAARYIKQNQHGKISIEYGRKIKKYWGEYTFFPTTVFHRWYTQSNGIEDVRYIPEDFFYDKIERYYNDLELEQAYSDKAMYKRLFPNVLQPETIILNMSGIYYDENYKIINKEEAKEIIMRNDRFVIKPTRDSGGGKNIRFISVKGNEPNNIDELLETYKKDFIVQKPLIQHPELTRIHSKSINTIRVMSMLENGVVTIVSTVIRMGIGDSFVDNECSGGINCGVDENGCLSEIAYDGSGKEYTIHPQGFVFKTGKIPSYDKMIEIITVEHKKLPYFGLISWDFTVDPEGNPVMIELNLRWCGLNFHQLHHGPLFGERTDEILNRVCNKNNQIGDKP